jgi:hypothetical protein
MNTFKELLGTDNKKEQTEKIEELLKIAANPEITLLIQYNGISDQATINLLGGDAPFDIIHRMLELASKAIRREELNAAIRQQVQDGEDKDPAGE